MPRRIRKRIATEWCATAVGEPGRGYGYTRGSMCFWRKKDALKYMRVRNSKGDPHYITSRRTFRELKPKKKA